MGEDIAMIDLSNHDPCPVCRRELTLDGAICGRCKESEDRLALIAAKDAEIARLREVVETMLDSAYPHPVEHPTMTKAWAIAKAAIAKEPTK